MDITNRTEKINKNKNKVGEIKSFLLYFTIYLKQIKKRRLKRFDFSLLRFVM